VNDALIDAALLDRKADTAEEQLRTLCDRLERNVDSVPGDYRSRAVVGPWKPADPAMLEEPNFCAVMRAAWKAGRGDLEDILWGIYQAQKEANAAREAARRERER